MTLSKGTRLGSYAISEAIGAGGMGEVYRARDTKLDRDVAIKVLPEEFAQDKERVARFEREAKLLASLNHSNIASIYGFESGALVLELVEGPTLAERIAKGPIPVDEAIAIARQIAEALEAGHEAGVIHRDLKPANIKLKEDGTVKVLDYGLAKALEGDAPSSTESELSQSPTLTRHGTQMGVILGTAAYMSPEQAKGKRVDKRTDIWAFGAVIYEMLTGKRAFGGEDVSDTLAAVLRAEPDFDALRSETPPSILNVLRICLTKDPKKRARDIGDVRLAIEGAFDAEPNPLPDGRAEKTRPDLRWILAALLVGAAVSAIVASQLRSPEPKPVMRFTHDLTDDQGFLFPGHTLALSVDGSQLVYSANYQLHVRRLDEVEARPVLEEGLAGAPVFSPDGEWIAYCTGDEPGLRKISIRGGAPSVLAEGRCRSADWSEDRIVYAGEGGLFRVPASGGAPERILETSLVSPQVLPDGETILGTLPSESRFRVAIESVTSRDSKTLFEGRHAKFVSTGHIIFFHDGALHAAPFNARSLEVTGEAVRVVEGVLSRGGTAVFDVSNTGTLAYAEARPEADPRRRVLGLIELERPDSGIERLQVPLAEYSRPRLSPDGERLVVQSLDENDKGTLWIYELSGGRAMRQLTFDGDHQRPIWTPDGEQITFSSDRDGTMSIYWMKADGSGGPERLTTAREGQEHWPFSWSPDGRVLAFGVIPGRDVWTLTLDSDTESLYADPARIHMGAEFSPDGRWLLYHRGEQVNSLDIYVEPFPPTGARHKISPGRGFWPMWARDGTAVFYRPVAGSRDMSLRMVDIVTEPDFGYSYERTLPIDDFVITGFGRDYDITPDGKKMLMVFPADDPNTSALPNQRIHIVLNWFEELKRLVPTDS